MKIVAAVETERQVNTHTHTCTSLYGCVSPSAGLRNVLLSAGGIINEAVSVSDCLLPCGYEPDLRRKVPGELITRARRTLGPDCFQNAAGLRDPAAEWFQFVAPTGP